jgi:hypothetical protein
MNNIEAIEIIKTAIANVEWDYPMDYAVAFEKALEALKEQEPVKPVDQGDDSYVCNNCGETVGWEEMACCGIDQVKFKYCPGCGRKVKWE